MNYDDYVEKTKYHLSQLEGTAAVVYALLAIAAAIRLQSKEDK